MKSSEAQKHINQEEIEGSVSDNPGFDEDAKDIVMTAIREVFRQEKKDYETVKSLVADLQEGLTFHVGALRCIKDQKKFDETVDMLVEHVADLNRDVGAIMDLWFIEPTKTMQRVKKPD
jgi:hypothetical protein